MRHLSLLLLLPVLAAAAPQSGIVKAADQLVSGATVIARQGETKVVAYTDENGHYTLNLASGTWDVEVQMIGFTLAHQQITVSDQPATRNWTLEMPKFGPPAAASASATAPIPAPTAQGRGQRGQGRGGQGRGGQFGGRGQGQGQGQGPGQFPGRGGPPAAPASAATPGAAPAAARGPAFQNAQVTATQDGQDLLAQAAQSSSSLGGLDAGADDADGAFLVNGSTSGGLGAASDDEARRQRTQAGGRGGPGGDNPGISAMGLPPGMSVLDNDSLGLGGLGAAAINGGFGGGPDGAGGFGGGGPGGPGGGGGGGGRGGGGGGPGGGGGGGGGRGGRGGGGGGGGGGRGAGRAGRGPANGQFASFGNRRRNTRPAYTGSISLNLANSALNAAPYSLNGTAAPKPSSNRANYTGSIGGPVIIPKIANFQRAQFTITYQGSVSRNPFSQLSEVPTPAELGGDFSLAKTNVPVKIFDPLSGEQFPNNVIPVTRFNSASVGLLKYFPAPSYTGVVQNYRNVTSVPNNSNSLGVRLNVPLNRKDRLNFNEQYQGRDSASEQLFGFRDTSTGTGLSASVGWNHSFAPRFNNSATLTFSRNNNKSAPFFAYSDNVAAALGIAGTAQDPINYGPPNLSFTNFGGLSDGSASVTRSQTTNFTDNVTYVLKKKHNLQMGFAYRRMQNNVLSNQNARGTLTFSGLLTSQIVGGQPVAGTGFDFADFLLGMPQSSSIRFGSNDYFRGQSTAAFVQDDYRVSRSLTLNIGLRWEYFTPYTEKYGRIANLDLAPGFTTATVVTPGSISPYHGALPSSLVNPEKLDLSPRFGYAWRPWAKHSTIFRGGYSILYTGNSYSAIVSQMAAQPPFAKSLSFSTSLANPITIQNGFSTTGTSTITNTYAIDPGYRLPYAQQWSFAIQQTLPHQLLLEVEEIGTKGTHLGVAEQPNQAKAGSSVSTAQQNLLIGNATGFTYNTYGANSIFNAGQVRFTRRFATGMSAVLLYTFSKSLDNASSFSGTGGTAVQFVDNWALERGLSSFDQRHKLTLTYTLSSPVGVRGMMRNGGWKTAALAGWTFNGNYSASSGTPLTATVSGNLSNTGGIGALGTTRAEATGAPIQGSGAQFFNPLAFTTPVSGQFGNAGRDTIPGPFQTSLNGTLNRAFRIGESRRQLQFRLSANNMLNHVMITRFGTTVNSSNFGLATGVAGMRTVQAQFRFNF